MSYFSEDSAVLGKVKELCEALVNDSNVKSLLESAERFLTNDAARLQYQSVNEKGQELSQKQHAGLELSPTEIRDFEQAREALFENQIAVEFLQAQQELAEIQGVISRYTGLSIELGRVPTSEEVEQAGNNGGGCCGGGSCGDDSCSSDEEEGDCCGGNGGGCGCH